VWIVTKRLINSKLKNKNNVNSRKGPDLQTRFHVPASASAFTRLIESNPPYLSSLPLRRGKTRPLFYKNTANPPEASPAALLPKPTHIDLNKHNSRQLHPSFVLEVDYLLRRVEGLAPLQRKMTRKMTFSVRLPALEKQRGRESYRFAVFTIKS
jgi:hypothetical protein